MNITKVILFILILTGSLFAQKHEKIIPFLIDLPGWSADDADGVAMDAPGMKMIQASRNYEAGDKELHVVFLAGGTMITQAQEGGISLDVDDVKMELTSIDGFKVNRYYDEDEDMTAVVVFIHESENNSALLNFTAEGGVSEDDLLAIAKKYDWKKLKETIKNLL